MRCFGGCGKPGVNDPELARPLNPQPQHVAPAPQREPISPTGSSSPSSKRVLRKAKTFEDVKADEKHRANQSLKHMVTVRTYATRRWMILVVTAVLSAMLSFSIDEFTMYFGMWRMKLTNNASSLPLVIVVNCCAVILARLINRTTIESEGSGFPEMKAMLFGKVMLNFLTLRALACKATSLALGVGAGLPIGKEGPNVHMAACISRALAPEVYDNDVPADGRARHLKTLRAKNLLLAATAVAVGSSFGAPIGGVIFALELMLPQIYDTIAYWGCFVSSVTGALCYTVLRTATTGADTLIPLLSTDVLPGEGATGARPVTRLLVDLLLGAICGLLGGLWIQAHAKVGGYMKRWRAQKCTMFNSLTTPTPQPASPIGGSLGVNLFSKTVVAAQSKPWWNVCTQWRDLVQVVFVVVLNTVCASKLPLLAGKPQPLLLSSLFGKTLNMNSDEWALESFGPLGTMFICYLTKCTMTILALTLPISAGVVAPVMIIGALLGRCYGLLLPDSLIDFLLSVPGDNVVITEEMRGALMARFAIVGAAAHSTAVCRAFAMAITVYEVLTLPSTLLPLCTSCLAAIFVANKVSIPFFDMNLTGRGLGGISALTQTDHAHKSATCVMRALDSDADCLYVEHCTVAEMRDLLARTDEDFEYIPILQNVESKFAPDGVAAPTLKGSIHRDNLRSLVKSGAPSKEICLLDADYIVPRDDMPTPLVCVNPQHITTDSIVSDVYIMMKATGSEVVFVIDKNCLVGVITYKELLGHRLDKPWFG